MTELILIRHGETDWNAQQRIQGHLDIPLNRTGLAQAEAIGERFRDVVIDVLVSSDLRRAMQTAAPLCQARQLELLREPRLRERHLGVLQGKTRDEAQQEAPTAFDVFRSRATDVELDEGESLAAFASRVADVVAELTRTHENKRIVAVTHGGVLDIAYRHATRMPLEAARNFPIHNASVSTFRLESGELRLQSWCDISHLPDQSAMDET